MSVENIEISPPPLGLEKEYSEIFTENAIKFLNELVNEFQERVTKMLENRKLQKLTLFMKNELPEFLDLSKLTGSQEWKISPLPERLQNRKLDLGDISPSNNELLKRALSSKVQGIQVDFDDGHCPSWFNMIKGIHNIISIVNGTFSIDVPSLMESPILLLRPRAWNMNEHNLMINGREIPGALMDFGLLIFHVGLKTAKNGIGPFFYLPKLENSKEAKLWDDIFSWAENALLLSFGTIKSCVLIENILAAFEMENILYELRHHSFGLNCGIWDYAASIVNIFGTRKNFVLPDRNKYVNLDKPFLNKYMKLVVQTCHKHGAPATGGMISFILPNDDASESDCRNELIKKMCNAKRKEIEIGVDGFLTYDTLTIPFLKDLWKEKIQKLSLEDFSVSANELLDIAQGGITLFGLKKNIKVGILFIYSWLVEGKGHFILDGAVEDSATAEISRSQIWQWIYHQIQLEEEPCDKITKAFVTTLTWDVYEEFLTKYDTYDKLHLRSACQILLEIVTGYEFPPFITSFLYNHSLFRQLNKT